MSETVKLNLSRWAVVVAILGGALTIGRSMIVDPDRVTAIESRQVSIETRQSDIERQLSAARETLARIDERTLRMDERLKEHK